MHVHAPHNIAVAHKATAPTGPVPSSRLLLPVTSRTAAAGSSLTAAEARDANLCTLLVEIPLVLAVLPLTHALVVMASLVLSAHPVGIAHVERLHPCLLAEVDHLPCALVPQVAHPPLALAAFARFGVLQATPALGALGAAGLQAREPPEHHVVVSLEAADAAPDDDQSLACAGRHRRLVDFPQIDGSLNRRSSRGWDFSLWGGGNDQVQFIASAPDQRDRSDLLRQIGQMEGEGLAPAAHGQDQALALAADGLGRPLHRPVFLGMVRVAMARVALAQLLDGLDVGEELLADHLDGLAVQRKLSAFGFPL